MNNSELKQDYSSPRWTNEIMDCSMPMTFVMDCSMPMTFDTYSKCSYHCLYCFSFYQKPRLLRGYDSLHNTVKEIRSVNPEKVKRMFERALTNDVTNASLEEIQYFSYIQGRRIMQCGGLADGFDEWERQYGVTLELLKYFDEIDYPLSFSTKGVWWTKDARYMELFRKHSHNWHVKVSIITVDKAKARAIEKGVPTPEQRLEAIKRLAEIGIHVTLRLRPYIIGISSDWKELISRAKESGADSVTVEFFCMEGRADEELKTRYAEMSEVCNFDIWEFYMRYSKQQGYKRLSREIKAPIINEMKEYVHRLGMRFHVSDAHCRESNDGCNCCGVPPEWEVSQRGHIGEAILIARDKGYVRYADIAENVKKYFGKLKAGSISQCNLSPIKIALNYGATMEEFIRNNWNDIKSGTSPARAYGGVLIPSEVDRDGDVVYKYNERNKR